MEDLTFGEQVKIILSRKKMTIKQLAEVIELQTGQKMSRQNLTQRLGRDNFQEQDMRMIASILGCPFTLNIITGDEAPEQLPIEIKKVRTPKNISPEVVELQSTPEERMEEPEAEMGVQTEEEHDMTIGEIYEIHEELDQLAEQKQEKQEPVQQMSEEAEVEEVKEEQQESAGSSTQRRVITPKDKDFEPVIKHDDLEEDRLNGDVNPYTGHEYQTNSVRVHPKRIGYVQVYDRADHSWTDMTEWAFLGYQERKKVLLGKEYDPPIYLD